MHEITSKQYTSVNIQCLCCQSGVDKINTSQARDGEMETTGCKKCIYKSNNKMLSQAVETLKNDVKLLHSKKNSWISAGRKRD